MQQRFHYQALPVNVFFSAGASKQTHRILKAPYFRKIALPATNPFSSHNILLCLLNCDNHNFAAKIQLPSNDI